MDLVREVKGRNVSINVVFNGLEVQQDNKTVEYKSAANKDTVSILGNIINGNSIIDKKTITLTLENFADSISKITFNTDDGKILIVKTKEFDRERISMQEVELSANDRSIGLGDIVKIVKEGKVTYKLYDTNGKIIKEDYL